MNTIDPERFGTISDLLDDAELQSLRWSGERGCVDVVPGCLRARSGTGGVLPAMTLSFTGVTALGLSFESWRRKPSVVDWPDASRALTMLGEERGGRFVYFSHDNEDWASDALSAPGLVWVHGDEVVFAGAHPRFVLSIERPVQIDGYFHDAWVLIAARGVVAMDDSGPVSLDDWAAQFDNWWRAWKAHWADDTESTGEPSAFSAAIPASEMKTDPEYVPPAEPVFDLAPHDLPDDLLAATRIWFEREHTAHGETNVNPWWPYAREVSSWWVDGARANVEFLGIRHTMPTENHPAENDVLLFGLSVVLRRGSWVVCEFSWGSPCTGLVATAPWMRAWNGGRIGPPSWPARLRHRLRRWLAR